MTDETDETAVDDDDMLDGCEGDFAPYAVTEEEEALLPLFPDGDPSKADEWKELFRAP